MALDEVANRIPDVVALDGHGVGLPGLRDGFQRVVEVMYPVRERMVGIVWKDLEQRPDDVAPLGEGRRCRPAWTLRRSTSTVGGN